MEGTTYNASTQTISDSLRIFQFNTNKANYKQNRPLLDALSPDEFPILALQEPYYKQGTTYCPRGYQLLYLPQPTTKVAFGIDKRLDPATWSYRSYSETTCQISIRTPQGTISITNVYNPGGATLSCEQDIIEAARAQEDNFGHILLGDFNLHHPRWGGDHVAPERAAEDLLALVDLLDLTLATPVGEATYARAGARTTIDLTFVSPTLGNRLLRCQPKEEMILMPDHFPICINFDIVPPPPAPPRRLRKALSREEVRDRISEEFKQWVIHHPIFSQWEREGHPPLGALAKDTVEDLLGQIQSQLASLYALHVPLARASRYAATEWTDECTQLLHEHRRNRRAFTATHSQENMRAYKDSRNKLKSALCKSRRDTWRRFLTKQMVSQGQNWGLWRMQRWARKKAGKPAEDPHIPALRANLQAPLVQDNEGKLRLLADVFFPSRDYADISDITGQSYEPRAKLAPQEIFSTEVIHKLIRRAASGKAAGPDTIPNELLKITAESLAPLLATLFSAAASQGHFPTLGKHTTTVTLRKDGRGDYSLPKSYRPIALENTLAKIFEAGLAAAITNDAEERELLPSSQFGARRGRSTLTALELLDSTVRTAWKGRGRRGRKQVISMLSLDIAAAYPNTSHPRLLHILRQNGYPPWMVDTINQFLSGRTTSLHFCGYQSPPVPVPTGLPQGSPLSPILFLLFAAELLFQFETGPVQGSGFVDDTNLITFSDSAQQNCRALERAHDKCLSWARRHGVQFSPDKYKLIHFTHKRSPRDTMAPIHIEGFDGKPCEELKVLGVWMDQKLTYRPHVQRTADRAKAQLDSLSRIGQSTWGLTLQQARLIYTAVVRPVLTYGAAIWANPNPQGDPSPSQLKPLQKVHREAIRRAAGAYRATPTPVLEKEVSVAPLDLYMQSLRLRHRARSDKSRPLRALMAKSRRAASGLLSDPSEQRLRQDNAMLRQAGLTWTDEGWSPPGEGGVATCLKRWLKSRWEESWNTYREGRIMRSGVRNPVAPPALMNSLFEEPGLACPTLYNKLTRAQASLLIQLRSEKIGFNNFLALQQVPEKTPQCECGWHCQTPRHIVISCPLLNGRDTMWLQAGTSDYIAALGTRRGAAAVTNWLMGTGKLDQFRVAYRLENSDPPPMEPLRSWW
jgi:hypothetical protein